MRNLKKYTVPEILNLHNAKAQNAGYTNDVKIDLQKPGGLSDELITAEEDRITFSGHNWAAYGGSTMDVNRNALRFVTNGDGGDEGVKLDLSYIKGQDGTFSITAGNIYMLICTLDNTSGKTTPKINAALGGKHVKVKAMDGAPTDGSIDTTVQYYYAQITTDDDTGELIIYQTSADNDATTTVEVDNITLHAVTSALNTQHLDVSGSDNIQIYSNRRHVFFNFATTQKDITGIRGGNAIGGEGVDNWVVNPDLESSTSNWSGILYEGGSGSGGTVTKNNSSNPCAGSKDLHVENGSGEEVGVYPTLSGISNNQFYAGGTYKVSFKYKTNFDGGNQPDRLNARIIGHGPYGGDSTTMAGDYTKAVGFEELTTNGAFSDDPTDTDLVSEDLTGWNVVNPGADQGNKIALSAADKLTFTIAGLEGDHTENNLYIKTDEKVFEIGQRYLVRINVGAIAGNTPVFEQLGGGTNKVEDFTVGFNDFIFEPYDNGNGENARYAVLRRGSGIGTFVITSISIRPYDVPGRPFIHDLENGGDLTQAAVEESFMFSVDVTGTRNLLFWINNTGSTNSIFQVDDVKVQQIENHTLKYSSSDLMLYKNGTYLLPVPDLGDTIYFNYLNDWPMDNTQIRIIKL